jgi:hypothetical protein
MVPEDLFSTDSSLKDEGVVLRLAKFLLRVAAYFKISK